LLLGAAFFACETDVTEQGLLGSNAYAQRATDRRENIMDVIDFLSIFLLTA